MDNTFYFLRHAAPQPDKSELKSRWTLSEEGICAAEELAESLVFDDVDIIISSDEEKAYQTAKPFADKLGKDIIRMSELNELDQGVGGFLEQKEFDRTIRFALIHWDKSLHKWETAAHALERFEKAINRIDSEYNDRNILIVSHGCVLSLYFAKLLNKLDEVYGRWSKTTFLNYGIVKDGKVFKDVVER